MNVNIIIDLREEREPVTDAGDRSITATVKAYNYTSESFVSWTHLIYLCKFGRFVWFVCLLLLFVALGVYLFTFYEEEEEESASYEAWSWKWKFKSICARVNQRAEVNPSNVSVLGLCVQRQRNFHIGENCCLASVSPTSRNHFDSTHQELPINDDGKLLIYKHRHVLLR